MQRNIYFLQLGEVFPIFEWIGRRNFESIYAHI